MSQTFEQFLEDRQGVATADRGVSDHHIDLWEHACLLFAAFEWEAAAELFAELSETITIDLYSTLCILNAAMIYARTGEFSRASQLLADVEHIEEMLPITLCLMGHVEAELGAYETSEDCFNIALGAFGSHPFQRFTHLSMDFVLSGKSIQQNLESIKTPTPRILATIPADVIFEAPPRATTSASTSRRGTRQWSIYSATPSDVLSSRSHDAIAMVAPLVPRPPIDNSESEIHHGTVTPQYPDPDAGLTSQSTAVEVPVTLASPAISRKDRFIARYTKLRAVGKKVIAQRRSPKKAPQVKTADKVEVREPAKRVRMEARDARPAGDTTATLSTFIRHLPKQNKLVARDARARPGSIVNLAEFFRDTGPEDTHAAVSMISGGSVGSISVESLSLTEPEVSGSQHNLSRRTTAPSMASHLAEQSGISDRAERVEAIPKLLPDTPELLGGGIAEPALEPSCSSSRPRNKSEASPQEQVRHQPRAIHPALRPGFSLDGQEM